LKHLRFKAFLFSPDNAIKAIRSTKRSTAAVFCGKEGQNGKHLPQPQERENYLFQVQGLSWQG
jgi:hypothetical protein